MFVKCHQDSFTPEEAQQHGWDMSAETELDLVNYGRLHHNYCSKYPTEAAPSNVIPAVHEEEQSRDGTPEVRWKKHSKVHDFVRTINKEEYGGHTHQCILCGTLLKQSKSATDKLIAHFGNADPTKPDNHPDEYRHIIVASRHSKLAVGADGQILRGTLAFKDALPHHVRFCMWMDDLLRPLAVAHDEGFRSFCDSLHPGYVPPHRKTIWKILELIQQLTLENLKQQLMAVKAQIGSPFLSLQTDMWTTMQRHERVICISQWLFHHTQAWHWWHF